MKIRMLRSESGAYSFSRGQEIEWLPDNVALKMVRQGRAVLIGPPTYETAVRDPSEVRDPFKEFLDRPARGIMADIPSQSHEALCQILLGEQRGKARRGLIAAIEAEIRSR